MWINQNTKQKLLSYILLLFITFITLSLSLSLSLSLPNIIPFFHPNCSLPVFNLSNNLQQHCFKQSQDIFDHFLSAILSLFATVLILNRGQKIKAMEYDQDNLCLNSFIYYAFGRCFYSKQLILHSKDTFTFYKWIIFNHCFTLIKLPEALLAVCCIYSLKDHVIFWRWRFIYSALL